MSKDIGERKEPTVDTLVDSDVDTGFTSDELSQDTIDAFKDFGDAFSSVPDQSDEALIDDDLDPEAADAGATQSEAAADHAADDIDIQWDPDIDLSWDSPSDADAAAADQQAGSAEDRSPDDEASPGDADPEVAAGTSGNQAPGAEENRSKANDFRFGNASSASEFLNSRMSMNDLVQEMAARAQKPAVSPVYQSGGPQPQLSQNQTAVPHATAVPESYPRMGLGSASMLLGAKGLSGLAEMIGSGGKAVSTAISDFTFGNAEKELNQTITAARAGLSEMKLGGLSVLEEDGMADDAKKALLKQYLNSQDNKDKFEALISKIDKMTDLSGKVMRKALDRGMDGDAVMNRAIDPVHRFMKDNEAMLKNLHSGDKSLHERLEGAVTALFEMLRDVLAHIQSMFQGQSQEQRQSGPRMG